jgi:drug/metabolite transporter (DMT)-like permease
VRGLRGSTGARLALLAAIWGSSFLWIKLALRGLSPLEVTFSRLILGAVVLFVLAAVTRASLPRGPALWGHIAFAAAFGNAAPYLLFALGEQHVSSSTAGILNATTPLWTVVVALVSRHERTLSLVRAAGLLVGFGGAVLVFSPWQDGAGLVSVGGIECLGAAVSYGVSFVYMDKFLARRGISPVTLSACQLLVASGFLGVALSAAGAPGPRLDPTVAISIAILGLFGTGLAYVLNYQIITSAGATSASTVTYLLPVVAIILGVTVLGEHVSVLTLAGIALILAGVALTRGTAQQRADRNVRGAESAGTSSRREP